MATYTSTQSGNWNDPATWGGSGYPNAAADVVNIGTTAGQAHIVTYNVSATIELATVTIGASSGTSFSRLDFATGMSTLLCFAAGVDLVIQATGELRVGESGSPVLSPYTAEVRFNTNNDNARGLYIYAGGKYSFYGDHDFYGDDYHTQLASAWTTGQTFTVVGDFTSKWRSGQLLYVHKGSYAAVATDNAAVTIASLAANGSNTDITINESFPTGTFAQYGDVINLSRNVKITKSGASSAVNNNNTNRPRIYDLNPIANTVGYCAFSNAEFVGIYRFNISNPIACERVVIRNGQDGTSFYGLIGDALCSVIIASCSTGTYTNRFVNYTDSVFTGSSPMNSVVGCTFSDTVRVYGNASAIAGSYGIGENVTIFSGSVYANNYAIQDGMGIRFVNAQFGYDQEGNSKQNTNADWRFQAAMGRVNFRSCKNVSTPRLYGRNSSPTPSCANFYFENYNRVLDDHRVYGGYGDSIKVVADNTSSRPSQRSGGNADVIEITTQSYCNMFHFFYGFLEHQIWATGGVSKTYRYYMQTDFDSLPASEICLCGEYINDATNHTITKVVSDEAITTRSSASDWSQYVEVTINPAETGWVRLSMRIMGYESTRKIWIDPKVSII